MSITAKDNGSDFITVEPGTYVARCYQITDLGTQRNEYEGQVSFRHQILISWEFPLEPLMDDGRPLAISKFYTLSLSAMANLYADLVSWRGKDFTEEEKQGFDIDKLLGIPCMLSVVKTPKGKAKVASVMGLPKGTDVPAQINPSVCFDLQAYLKGDDSVYNTLTEGLQGLVGKSMEVTKPIEDGPNDDIPDFTGQPAPPIDAYDDDVPF